MGRRGFICAGCWTVDRIKLIDHWPVEEQLARITLVDRQGGGSAYNVGLDIRKLDPSMPVAAIGLVGNDEDGDFLYQQAAAHELDLTQLHRTQNSATSYTDVMSVSDSGKRTFFHYPGANDLLEPSHIDFSTNGERILHLGLLSVHALMDQFDEDGSNGWSKVLQQAQSFGIKTSIEMVSVDPILNRKLVLPCLPFLDYLIVNDHEIGAIAQRQTLVDGVADIPQCIEAANIALSMGNMQLVAVHFPGGAVCVSCEGSAFVTESLSVPQSMIKSSVGAGDAFVAGFLYAIHENKSLSEAMELAHTVAACSLRSMTTTGAVESVDKCRQFASQLAHL
ncbi:MAG: carbohydrate kinase family protein [Granulosicoccus sp.]